MKTRRNTAYKRPRYSLENSPAASGARVLQALDLAEYIRGQAKTRMSNMDAPLAFDFKRFPIGAWLVDDFALSYGHSVEQLAWVALTDIVPTELHGGRLDPTKRRYLDVYIQWFQEGFQPPPVHIVEAENGDLRLTDGHRRYLAAQVAGVPALLALVSYHVPGSALEPTGKIIPTDLTLEIALQDMQLAGRQALTSAQWDDLYTKYPSLRKRAILLAEGPR